MANRDKQGKRHSRTDLRLTLASSTQVKSKKARTHGKKKNTANHRNGPDRNIDTTAGVGTVVPEAPVTPTPIMLRPFTNEDQTFVLQMTKEEMGPIFRESYGYELNLDNVLQYVHSAQTRMILVNDQTAGYVSAVVDDGGKMNIGSLILTGEHKRKGYGTRIMRQLEQEARSMGLVELEAFIQSSNQASINLCKKLGFREVPSMQPQTIIMVKDLRTTN